VGQRIIGGRRRVEGGSLLCAPSKPRRLYEPPIFGTLNLLFSPRVCMDSSGTYH